MALKSVTKSITSDDTWTDAIKANPQRNPATRGHLAISIVTTNSTIAIQRSFDNGSNWYDVDEFGTSIQTKLFDPAKGVVYRIGIKAGDYDTSSPSETVEVGLHQ